MKRIAAVLAMATLSSAAAAQSQVQMYGIIDLNVGKDIGSSGLRQANGTVSRIGFNGSEDLGNGMTAFFDLLHRFNPDTGMNNGGTGGPAGPFWAGGSVVGLSGSYGKIILGRAVAEAAIGSQILCDPWFWDNVTSSYPITSGAIGHVWYNNSVSYEYSRNGFSLGVQEADMDSNSLYGPMTSRPVNGYLRYTANGMAIGMGHEKTGEGGARWSTVDGSVPLGKSSLSGLVGAGRNAADQRVRSLYISSSTPVGAYTFVLAYGRVRTADMLTTSKLAAGAYYALSKRTSLYTNVARDAKVPSNYLGYEFGIRHTF